MAETDKFAIEEAVAKHGTKPSNGKVLAVFAASGTARRFRGTYFVMQLRHGGGVIYTPAVLLPDGLPLALDPRAMVYDDGTLAVFWNPRGGDRDIHPAAVAWFERNPDVFRPETGNGITAHDLTGPKT